MKTIEELRDYILEHRVDEYGNVDLSGLDFSEFNGDVNIGRMKVKRSLDQSDHEVKGLLGQSRHKVKGSLFQSFNIVQGNLLQHSQGVQGNLDQSCLEVQGNLYQSSQEVQGDYYCEDVKVGGAITVNKPTKILREITTEELKEMGLVHVG